VNAHIQACPSRAEDPADSGTQGLAVGTGEVTGGGEARVRGIPASASGSHASKAAQRIAFRAFTDDELAHASATNWQKARKFQGLATLADREIKHRKRKLKRGMP